MNRLIAGLDSGTCPIAGCGAPTPRGYWTCRACWRELPDLLKSEIREAVKLSWSKWCASAVAAMRYLESD